MSTRLFVAVAVDAARARLVEQARALRSALRAAALDDAFRWVADENLHVTLRFLGDVDDAAVPSVSSALGRMAAPAGKVTFDGAGTFPPRGRPRLLHVRVASGQAYLSGLRDLADAALAPICRWEPETRPFAPHLTLARARDRAAFDPAALATAMHAVAWEPVEMAVEDVRLFSSVTHASGPRYSELARAALRSA